MISEPILELINQHLKKYEAEFDTKENIVEFNGNKYPIYFYIFFNSKENQFGAGLGNNITYLEKDFNHFHVEKIFAERIIKKLNKFLKQNHGNKKCI